MLVKVILNFRVEGQLLPTAQVRRCAQALLGTPFSKAVAAGGIRDSILIASERSLSLRAMMNSTGLLVLSQSKACTQE